MVGGQQEEGWGRLKVIENLARHRKRSFPQMEGFSIRNVKYLKTFAEAWPDEKIVEQLVGQVPCGHSVRLIDKISFAEERGSSSEATQD